MVRLFFNLNFEFILILLKEDAIRKEADEKIKRNVNKKDQFGKTSLHYGISLLFY